MAVSLNLSQLNRVPKYVCNDSRGIMFHKCHSRAPVYLVLHIFTTNMLVLQSKLRVSSNAVL